MDNNLNFDNENLDWTNHSQETLIHPRCDHHEPYAQGVCVLCGQAFPFCPRCELGIFCVDCRKIQKVVKRRRDAVRRKRLQESKEAWLRIMTKGGSDGDHSTVAE